jgi:Ankyrin repeats (3 copies)
MADANPRSYEKHRNWPLSLSAWVLLAALLAYLLFCLRLSLSHIDMIRDRSSQVSPVDLENYVAHGNLYNSISYMPLAAIRAAIAILATLVLLICGRFVPTQRGKKFGPFEFMAIIAFVISLGPSSNILLHYNLMRRYEYASQPELQRSLCTAAQNNRPDDLKALIMKGADPDSVADDAEGNLKGALEYAVTVGNKNCVDVLLQNGAWPEGSGKASALFYAVDTDRLEIARALIRAGANPNFEGNLALACAIRNKHYAAAELFFQTGLNKKSFEVARSLITSDNDPRNLELLKKYKPVD